MKNKKNEAEKAFNYLVGQVIKAFDGKVSPKLAREILERKLADVAQR